LLHPHTPPKIPFPTPSLFLSNGIEKEKGIYGRYIEKIDSKEK